MTSNNKETLIFFDLVLLNNGDQCVIGCFSIPASKLPEVSTNAICEYIAAHYDEYNKSVGYKLTGIHKTTWGFFINHLDLTGNKSLLVSNIHRL